MVEAPGKGHGNGHEPLSASKRALLDLLLADRGRASQKTLEPASPAVIVPDPAERHAPFPLTALQQAYWVARTAGLDLGDVAVHCYQELEAVDLDLARLELAWRLVIERHDMLRAVVLPDGRQRVLERVPAYAIGLHDLSGLPPEAARGEIETLRSHLQRLIFRSDEWPLFAIRATRLPGGQFRVHFAFDGLLLDGWSYHILFGDLVDLYRNPELRRPPLALSFRDYVLAERELSAVDPQVQRGREFWRARLPELPPPPALPVERGARDGHPGFVRQSFTLDSGTWSRLKQLGARSGLTPTGLVLAAYAEVVAAWSSGSRFTLSLPRFNRLPLHPEVERVVGEFASFALIGVDLSRREPFRERARQVQEELWKVLEHGGVDGVELARRAGRGGDAAAPVVFTSMLGIADQDASAPLLALGEIVYRVTQTPQVWLDCLVQEHAGALNVDWDCVAGLFPPGLPGDMLDAFHGLLHGLATDEESWERTGRPPLPRAQADLLAALNDTGAEVGEELTPALIRRQAEARPGATALISQGRTFTYGELLQLSANWAATLQGLGARPNHPVAVVMEKGWEQVVAVLAVLEAGAAFLPIDPGVAPARLRRILELGGIDLLLTQPRLEKALAWPDGVRRVSLDAQPPLPASGWEPAEPHPEDLAYVLFTSGSTGTPKGAMISHLGLANALVATHRGFAIGAGDRVLALTALHHDMSLFDLLGLLAAGGSLVLPEPARVRDPGHWLDLIALHEVTVWNSVPAMMEMLLEFAGGRPVAGPRSLRLVFLGGDWISLSLPDRLRRLAPGVQIVSVGGPTETTLWNIWYRVGEIDARWRSIPYGRPIANNRYHVLSDTLDPCPVWVPGELYGSGVGLARGYWRDEEAGRRAFVPDPRTGERLYRTGDLGRLLPDGNLEILGRADQQIKLDGQRIEPGEIEAALLTHPLVASAVVVPAGERGSLRLAAFVVADHVAEGEKAEFKLGQPGLRQGAGGPAISLPGTDLQAEESREAYVARRSFRWFLESPCPGAALAALLGGLQRIDLPGSPLRKSRYPSAGGLYAVEIRLEVKPGRVEGIPGGVYLYDPARHGLAPLSGEPAVTAEDHLPVNREIFARAAFTIYLIGDLATVASTYGEWAEPFCLLEAGAIGQLLMSAGAGHGIGLCPIGQIREGSRLPLGPGRRLLHALLGGPVAAGQRDVAAFLAEASRGTSSLAATLRAHLRERLPEPMVPASWTFLDALPLSANGKVDRSALVRRAAGVLPAAASPAPRSELERAIAEIWREVLGGAQPGVDDNFFDLGGNSLQLIQVHRRLSPLLAHELPLVAMFRKPTIRALAAVGEESPRAGIEDRLAKQRRALGRPAARRRRGEEGS